jgi:hypothetical protein
MRSLPWPGAADDVLSSVHGLRQAPAGAGICCLADLQSRLIGHAPPSTAWEGSIPGRPHHIANLATEHLGKDIVVSNDGGSTFASARKAMETWGASTAIGMKWWRSSKRVLMPLTTTSSSDTTAEIGWTLDRTTIPSSFAKDRDGVLGLHPTGKPVALIVRRVSPAP